MKSIQNSASLFLIFLLTWSVSSADTQLPSTVTELRSELDAINFTLADNDARVKRLEVLVPHTEELAKQNNTNAGFQMMAGFYNAQYAGVKGGIGALKYAKASRKFLELSVKLDPNLYGAAAHAVLGTLYAQVPGWPIGFGDKKKALKNYRIALELSPDGVDSNYTYAGYLFSQKKYAEAKRYLDKAERAPARPDRPIADEKLKEQFVKFNLEIEKKLADEK